jgi:Transposase
MCGALRQVDGFTPAKTGKTPFNSAVSASGLAGTSARGRPRPRATVFGPDTSPLRRERGRAVLAQAPKCRPLNALPRSVVTMPSARHSSYQRRLWDLPNQGRPVRITLTVGRWQCRNAECSQSICTERLPGIVDPRSRQTRRAAGILRLLGHGVGGRPGESLAARLGFAGSRTTILRHLLHHQGLPDHSAPRVVGLDEWASKKGLHYGTIAVDLERRTVIDILPDRSAVSTARWLAGRSSIELIARDRDGLYADASRQRAPQAKQIAHRFHLIQILRDAIERQLCGLERPIRGYRAKSRSPCRQRQSTAGVALTVIQHVAHNGHRQYRTGGEELSIASVGTGSEPVRGRWGGGIWGSRQPLPGPTRRRDGLCDHVRTSA